MPRYVLGISAYYHDSAAALMRDGALVAAAQEERFSRIKHDARFPAAAVTWCLQSEAIALADIEAVVFYDKPFLKFERLLETYIDFAPRGFASFRAAMPVWLRDKLYLKQSLRAELSALGATEPHRLPPLRFSDHHRSHAASAFFFSPYERAAVLCLDGVGEWATTSAWLGHNNRLEPLWEINFPHSLGLLYSAFTAYAGFRVNSGEYKLMGLAPYGTPEFVDTILTELVDLKSDGTFRLNLQYFDYCTGLRMTNDAFAALFGGPARAPGSAIDQRHMNVAASIQRVTEEIVLRLARTLHRETGESQLCLAGGVALNCVANGRLVRETPYRDLWIQPAAGDAGGAPGAAAVYWYLNNERRPGTTAADGMSGALLGPGIDDSDSVAALDSLGAHYETLDDDALVARVAAMLASGSVVGWVQGRMEFGPRALGNRSILADPRSATMQSRINRRIKYREDFRPFAPAVLAGQQARFFDLAGDSPYMLLVAPVHAADSGVDLPAVTHVDGSARVQTVHPDSNPRFHALLQAFDRLTGCPVLVNTSFNLGGEPIVRSPEDAYDAFMRSELDVLVIGNRVLERSRQPAREVVTADPAPNSRASITVRLRAGLADVAATIALAIVYGLVVIPTGVIRKWRGRSRLQQTMDPGCDSYREPTRHPEPPKLDKLW